SHVICDPRALHSFPTRRSSDLGIAAAVAAQRALAAHDWPDGVEVRVRMGLHTGEPSLSESGFVSLAVHRGARICAAGHGGQVLRSEEHTSELQSRFDLVCRLLL